ncbi:DinB family protein [Marininema mesophilum]|uniref:DinB family protein n=1 Tax=Marininema mesophilum TaxID=1048340 RepID=UPI0015A5DC9C|nr:DinB family protein [Marininema mesophilum]
MDKKKICQRLGEMTDFIHTLKTVSTDQWMKPIGEGKWSPLEIVAHLHFWDRYLIEERLPEIEPDGAGSLEIEDINLKASLWTRSGVSCEEVIEQFLEFRGQLLRFLEGMPDADWDRMVRIGNHTISLAEYILEAIDHDEHHREQLRECFMKNVEGGTIP